MPSLAKHIETIIYEPQSQGSFPVLSFALHKLSTIYSQLMRLREQLYLHNWLKQNRLSCKVISIGNITVGGTGKTPMTLYIARMLHELGYRVVIISRGYKGKNENQGCMVSDGKTILVRPEISGDEPYLMALRMPNIPVFVGKNRYQIGCQAVSLCNPDIIILDDAFQHIQLFRDLDIVLLDATYPFGNGNVLPRGSLREPVSALNRAHAIILTRSEEANSNQLQCTLTQIKHIQPCVPVFISSHQPYVAAHIRSDVSTHADDISLFNSIQLSFLKHKNVFVFSGIAKPQAFRSMLENLSCVIQGHLDFPDHYAYHEKDVEIICQKANEYQVDFLITTEKDYVKFPNSIRWPKDIIVMGVQISIDQANTTELQKIIQRIN
ncbi:MAG: tetraacyldisaccharide 4'-kinase [Desulfobacterales bacterium]|nr:tetraacyldisaccharide 4'-kinase [Desulfobacterales bacterium]